MYYLVVLYDKYLSGNSRNETEMSENDYRTKSDESARAMCAYGFATLMMVGMAAFSVSEGESLIATIAAIIATLFFFFTIVMMVKASEYDLKEFIENTNTTTNK